MTTESKHTEDDRRIRIHKLDDIRDPVLREAVRQKIQGLGEKERAAEFAEAETYINMIVVMHEISLMV